MPDWTIITPEQITALGASVAAIVAAFLMRGKASRASASTIVQQAIRPETDAERRSSDALERIAASVEQVADRMDRIERNSVLLVERTRGK
ncbi:hypothetical protein [Oceaniglobus trochenteri]|uniref:hypothetical protein n=1 Tax=Oceaniglobus trochenteri TaxID=2763260 RepID=UPI001CFFCD49|nr:hypothetical protein [Oceaniglobus trochenteri]